MIKHVYYFGKGTQESVKACTFLDNLEMAGRDYRVDGVAGLIAVTVYAPDMDYWQLDHSFYWDLDLPD